MEVHESIQKIQCLSMVSKIAFIKQYKTNEIRFKFYFLIL